MKRFVRSALLSALALASASTLPVAFAQAGPGPTPVIAPGSSVLTLSAQGQSVRAPDLAVFTAGVTSQADTASAALAENSRSMNAVVAALKRAGIAARDLQTSNLSINPVYAPARRLPDGSVESGGERIIAYRATNTVTVRQRKLDEYGRVIDTLVSSGANQVSGPNFMIDSPEAARDEARTAAVGTARQRAELYARAAGLRVVRILSIDEGGGYAPPRPIAYARAQTASAAPPPVEPGELEFGVTVTMQFELAP